MKPCKTCKEFSCGANGSDYVSMRCGSEEGFIRADADCFSLPNAAELVEFFRKESESMIVEYVRDGYRLKEAADAIEQLLEETEEQKRRIYKLAYDYDEDEDTINRLMKENTKLKAERDAAVHDLKISSDCDFCKYNTDDPAFCEKSPRGDECMGKRWEWRGVQHD